MTITTIAPFLIIADEEKRNKVAAIIEQALEDENILLDDLLAGCVPVPLINPEIWADVSKSVLTSAEHVDTGEDGILIDREQRERFVAEPFAARMKAPEGEQTEQQKHDAVAAATRDRVMGQYDDVVGKAMGGVTEVKDQLSFAEFDSAVVNVRDRLQQLSPKIFAYVSDTLISFMNCIAVEPTKLGSKSVDVVEKGVGLEPTLAELINNTRYLTYSTGDSTGPEYLKNISPSTTRLQPMLTAIEKFFMYAVDVEETRIQNPLVVTVLGCHHTGKTLVSSIIEQALAQAGFANVQLVNAEQPKSDRMRTVAKLQADRKSWGTETEAFLAKKIYLIEANAPYPRRTEGK